MSSKNGKNIKCLYCGKEFYVGGYKLSTRKYCSMKCSVHSPLRTKEIYRANAFKNIHRLDTHGGGYHAVHKWLSAHFGKADKCENAGCMGKSKIYQWALLKGKKHEHKRENYKKMCASCHRKYDQKPEWAIKAENTRKEKGKKL